MTAFFLAPVLLHGLGAGAFGFYSVLQDAALYLGVLEAGMSTTTVQRVAHLDAMADREQLLDVLAAAKAFFFASSLATTVLVLAVVPFVGDLFQLGPVGLDPARLALALAGVTTVSSFFTFTGSALLYGAGRGDRLGLVSSGATSLTRVIQITVALAGGGLIAVVAVSAVLSACVPFIINLVAARTFPEMQVSMRRCRRSVLVPMLRSGRRNATIAIGGALTFGFDALVIGVIRPVAQVAPYSLAYSVTSLAQSIATGGTSVLAPNLAYSYAKGDLGLTYRLYRVSLIVSLAVFAPIAVVLIVFGHPLLGLWLGHVPAKTYEVLVVLAATYVLQLPGYQAFVVLTAIDRNRSIARVALFLGLANLALSVVGTYRYGPVGPALGSLVEVVVVEMVAFPLLVARILEGPRRLLLGDVLAPFLGELAVAVGVGVLLRLAVDGHAREWAVPAGAATVVVSLAAVALMVRGRYPELAEVSARIRSRLGRSR